MTDAFYLLATILFIMSIRGLASPETALRGNKYGMIGMAICILVPMALVSSWSWIIAGIALGGVIGTVMAKRAEMKALPQMVALFNAFVGLAAVFIAGAEFYEPQSFGIGIPGAIHTQSLIEMSLGVLIGAVTFTGSVVAFAKLQGIMGSKPWIFPSQLLFNAVLGGVTVLTLILFVATQSESAFWSLSALSFVLGVMLVVRIGGADMPVVISMLNSYSGFASTVIGFSMDNTMLIIAGSLVGASGAILSYIMCKSMNRSFLSVILGGFGAEAQGSAKGTDTDRPVKAGSADDAAFLMKNASSVIIVPGYGMAVAQAQHSLKEMGEILKKAGVKVRYAIHPVAGRMPGHMNVLLAEANVPYDDVKELDDINNDFKATDIAFVIGANDVTNPAAKDDPQSPIYGMPVLDVASAKTTLFVKRSMASGYAGVANDLFYRDKTMMLFGDAKQMVEEINQALAA